MFLTAAAAVAAAAASGVDTMVLHSGQKKDERNARRHTFHGCGGRNRQRAGKRRKGRKRKRVESAEKGEGVLCVTKPRGN